MSGKSWNARDEPKKAHHGRNKKNNKLCKKGYKNEAQKQSETGKG